MTHLLSSLIQKPEKMSYEGRDKDEQILYVIRKSRLILILRAIPLLIATSVPFYLFPYLAKFNIENGHVFNEGFFIALIVAWYLFCFGYMLLVFINWYFNVLIVSTKKIVDIDIHGLLYKNVSEAALRNVEDVTSTVKGTLGTVFNIGDVFLQTAGEEREFEFTLIDNPSYIRDIISDLVSNLREHDNNN